MAICKVDTNHHQPFDWFDGEYIWEINKGNMGHDMTNTDSVVLAGAAARCSPDLGSILPSNLRGGGRKVDTLRLRTYSCPAKEDSTVLQNHGATRRFTAAASNFYHTLSRWKRWGVRSSRQKGMAPLAILPRYHIRYVCIYIYMYLCVYRQHTIAIRLNRIETHWTSTICVPSCCRSSSR